MPDKNTLSFGQTLAYERKKNELTQEQLGEIVGKSISTIKKYELNQREPNHETLIKFAIMFNVSIDYLLCNVKLPQRPLTPLERQELVNNFSSKLRELIKKEYWFYLEHKSDIDPEEFGGALVWAFRGIFKKLMNEEKYTINDIIENVNKD